MSQHTQLAYVFWHWPAPGVDRTAYDDAITVFHSQLHTSRLAGFQTSGSFVVEGLPWASRVAYEDWYLVDDFAALEHLSDTAVSGSRQAAHQDLASAAARSVGGLYRHYLGATNIHASCATWLSKPRGMDHATFGALLEAAAPAGSAVWRRQLVLGPGPGYCLISDRTVTIPAILGVPITTPRQTVFYRVHLSVADTNRS